MSQVNILLVDDQPSKLLSYQSILQDLGENLVLARSGREALQRLLKDEFAVILLDVVMPEMDGFETAALIRQHPRWERTPIIFITAYSSSDLEGIKGYELGAVDFVFAPVVPAVLRTKVSVFVELYRKRLELHLANVQLERSNRDLEKFAFVASHDLQEPLRKICAFGDRLQARCGTRLDEQSRDYLQRMTNAAGRMYVLINDLLDYARVTSKTPLFSAVDLAAIAREALSDLEEQIRQVHGQVAVGPLPTIEADALQMRQLLQNLISNGLKFHKPDEAPLVQVQGRLVPPNLCEITVQDNGIGFDEKYLDRLFQIFQRLHGPTEYQGTGIGLAVCRKIVERHAGRISAHGVPGQGATFMVALPVRQQAATRGVSMVELQSS